ncbi:UNVERIFIED_CONTAM: hypothetical protein FKN15_040359 [Acipenser sinensis]
MLRRKNKKQPLSKGHGAAAAKQMGLFMDFSPDEMMMELDGDVDDGDLEAEFAAIMGTRSGEGGKPKPKGKTPLPMEDIEKMAENCMRDSDNEDDDEDLENDEDLLVPEVTAAPSEVQRTLEERIGMYKTAIINAKASGETSKARRYDRGLKQYQDAIRAHKAGRTINFAELPVPPGFPPIPGMEGVGAEQGIAAVLEAASKLASDEGKQADEEDEEDEVVCFVPFKT